MRKMLSLILSLGMLFTLFPAALAEEVAAEAVFEEEFLEGFLDEGLQNEEAFGEESEAFGTEDVEERGLAELAEDLTDRAKTSLDYTKITLYLGTNPTAQLHVSGYEGSEVEWKSSNANVASVDGGWVTAIKEGSAKITAKAGGKSYTCKVTVNGVKYRALLIGNTYKKAWQFGWKLRGALYFYNCLVGPAYDLKHMETVLKSFNGTKYSVTKAANLKKKKLASKISKTFKKADENDVSLIYYSGHGGYGGKLIMDDGYSILPDDLAEITDAIPGKKILIVDACYSGELIGKDGENSAELAAFNDSFIDAFRSSDLVDKSGEFATSSYCVITACSSEQKSYDIRKFKTVKELGPVTNWPYDPDVLFRGGSYYYIDSSDILYQVKSIWGGTGLMTYAMVEGLGYHFTDTDKYDKMEKGELSADSSKDGGVTIPELYNYISAKTKSSQTAQKYCTTSDANTVFFRR